MFRSQHASLMQIKRNSVTALRLEYRSNLFSVKMYLLLLFRLYFIQTVEQPASPTTKKMKPEWK